ncbi:MAG: ComEC/Rec2 family competence protein [Anaerolineales bacterium]
MAISSAAPFTALQWLSLAGISLAALWFVGASRPARLLFGLLCLLCLGAARQQHYLSENEASHLSHYNDFPRSILLTGIIVDYPDQRDSYTGIVLQAETLQATPGPESAITGRALVRADRFGEWRFGDRVEFVGRLETPPEFEDFSYRAYLARQGIHSLMRADKGQILEADQGNPALALIFKLRARAHAMVGKLFPEPEASLLSGILLGLESGIDPALRAQFNRTGTTHIIAISGFNITIIAGLFIVMGRRWLGARWGSFAAATAVVVYTLLVGADAAVVRAAVMATIALIAQRLGRQTDGLATLGAAAIFMTALNPPTLADVGFQLSFAATLGLLLYAGPFTDTIMDWLSSSPRFSERSLEKLAGPLSEFFTVTLAAQITTLPLLIYHFERLSLVSPFANLLILPAQPAVMLFSGLATLAGLVWQPLGRLLAWLSWPFAAYTIETVQWLADLPIASLATPPVSLSFIAACYLGLLGVTFLHRIPASQRRIRVPWPLLVGFLLLANYLAWHLVTDRPDGRLHLTLLDTGANPGVLIESPQGRRLLIDGGASSIKLGINLDERLSPFQRELDWIILTHPNEETAAGIAGLIERYLVGGALVVEPARSAAFQEISQSLNQMGRPIGKIEDGQVLSLDRGISLRLEYLDSGSAIEVSYGRARYLLLYGQPRAWPDQLPQESRRPNVSALLLPASGDANISPPSSVRALEPKIMLLAIEPGEARGLPARSLLDEMEGRPILRTDQHGWIRLSTDGVQMWVETQRESEYSVEARNNMPLPSVWIDLAALRPD